MNNATTRIQQDPCTRTFGHLAVFPSSYISHSHKPHPALSKGRVHPYKLSVTASSSFSGQLTAPSLASSPTTSLSIFSRKTGTSRSSTTATAASPGGVSSNSVPKKELKTRSTPEDGDTVGLPKMAAIGLNSLMHNPVVAGMHLGASTSTFALKLGALNSSQNVPTPTLSRSPISAFASGSNISSRSSLMASSSSLPPNLAVFPSGIDPPPHPHPHPHPPPPSLMPVSPLFQYPAVLATSLSPDEQQYLRMAQLQVDADKVIPGGFKAPYASRNYLELAMLVCNTFRGKLFPCPHCRYVTDRRNNLKRHVATMHQACDKQLECCGVTFATKASLREHIAIFHHNGYSCAFCGRRFCRKALLKRHLSVHNGQKDYTCPHCDYATSHKSNLERHKRIHARINVIGGSPNFPDEGEEGDHDVGYLDEPGPGVPGNSERYADGQKKNICFQNARLTSLDMVRAMNEREPLINSVKNLCHDRRSTIACTDSGFSKAEQDGEFTRDGKEEVGNIHDEDVDSDSDIDIDGMEDCDLIGSDDETKRVSTGNDTGALNCDTDDIHPLNLVKSKASDDK